MSYHSLCLLGQERSKRTQILLPYTVHEGRIKTRVCDFVNSSARIAENFKRLMMPEVKVTIHNIQTDMTMGQFNFIYKHRIKDRCSTMSYSLFTLALAESSLRNRIWVIDMLTFLVASVKTTKPN